MVLKESLHTIFNDFFIWSIDNFEMRRLPDPELYKSDEIFKKTILVFLLYSLFLISSIFLSIPSVCFCPLFIYWIDLGLENSVVHYAGMRRKRKYSQIRIIEEESEMREHGCPSEVMSDIREHLFSGGDEILEGLFILLHNFLRRETHCLSPRN